LRARLVIVSAIVLALPLAAAALVPAASAREIHLAQAGDKAPKQKPAQPSAEPSPSASSEPEAGPPWTYQMSKIALVLLALVLLAVAGAYYRFVFVRRRGEV
jgi:hypothetical protein